MEKINKTPNSDRLVIKPTSKKNIYKYLFIISVVFCALLLKSVLYYKNIKLSIGNLILNQTQSSTPNNKSEPVIPTKTNNNFNQEIPSLLRPTWNPEESTNEIEDSAIYKESSIKDWVEYINTEFGFSFSYPKEYGKIKIYSSLGTEIQQGRWIQFNFYKEGDECSWYSCGGVIEIGAASPDFGGVGTGRPLAYSAGFIKNKDGSVSNRLLSRKFSGHTKYLSWYSSYYDGLSLDSSMDKNMPVPEINSFKPQYFKGENTEGLITQDTDDSDGSNTISIEFNLNHREITGIKFMTFCKIDETENAEILKSITKTFRLLN